MHRLSRRRFLKQASQSLAGITSLGAVSLVGAQANGGNSRTLKQTYRAAAIGSTGRGDFGHRLDQVFCNLPNVEFVALADDNPQGLANAGKRNGVDQLYSDYRKMLVDERIDVVSIGTRHSELHEEMVIHCAQAGKHIYCEKPLSTDLASADRMIAACDQHGVKLAVAVPNRASLAIAEAVKMVSDGRIGELLKIEANGKDDHRGGGEDLMVLGYHMLDLMCLFAGQPLWTFAQVQEGERDMETSDARPATEPIGPVAGDCVAAMYGFPNQVHGYFESHRDLQGGPERFSIKIYGSEGIIASRSLRDIVWFEGPVLNPARTNRWLPISTPEWDAIRDNDLWCRQQQVLDLLQAAEEDREPRSSGKQARWVEEMIQSVYVSHLAQARVPLPLRQRKHPLS
ncbi:MAG: Gfo/Idh/MocA family oxidoreductase [Planctomycetales bacterium]|nr:Gfo/Idh/MocA family oxidoreductase [Planctomycetales bacterium]